ncbi:MAG TPA: prepilin peptidase [Bacillota bacterium]|nr:prepilin peptidase [Bacillota bacterium]
MDRFLYTLWVFVFGLVTGSFLNVCIYRIPRGVSLFLPASRCTACNSRLAPLDLIPAASYLILRGRCRNCGSFINIRYFIVEVLTGLLFAAGYARLGFQPVLIKTFFFISIMIVLSFIDLEHYMVPNGLVLTGLVAGAVFLLVCKDVDWKSAFLGAVSSTGFLFALTVISRGGVGGGDIKLAAVIGLFLGWPLGLLSVFIGCCLAGVAGIIMVLLKKMKLRDIMPFVPFLALGSGVTAVWGAELTARCPFF